LNPRFPVARSCVAAVELSVWCHSGREPSRNTADWLLTEFPDQKQKLIAQPELLGNAANEFIRMVSPVIYMRRTATKDVEVAGQQIAEGE